MGVASKSTEYLVGTEEGIIVCANISRLADDFAYDKDIFDIIKVRYHEFARDGGRTLMSRASRTRLVENPDQNRHPPLHSRAAPLKRIRPPCYA